LNLAFAAELGPHLDTPSDRIAALKLQVSLQAQASEAIPGISPTTSRRISALFSEGCHNPKNFSSFC
jgi:hypothetical protein